MPSVGRNDPDEQYVAPKPPTAANRLIETFPRRLGECRRYPTEIMPLNLDHIPDLAEAFAVLRYDPNAKRGIALFGYEYVWSDERPVEQEIPGEISISDAMRYLLGYRASLIRQAPFEPLTLFWSAFLYACPTWPGFRNERCSPSLAAELDSEIARMLFQMDRYAKICERKRRLRARDLPEPVDDAG